VSGALTAPVGLSRKLLNVGFQIVNYTIAAPAKGGRIQRPEIRQSVNIAYGACAVSAPK
jgi:hypothetical protein